MKSNIISHNIVNSKESIFHVELIPDSKEEAEAIKSAEKMEYNETVNNYLSFCLGERYSPDKADPLGNGKFRIIAFDNTGF